MNSSFLDFKIIAAPDQLALPERCVGGNQKKILVVYCSGKENLEKPFLAKVLAAAKIDIEQDILTLQLTAGEKFSLAQLLNFAPFNYCLLFGITPQQAGIQIQPTLYQAFVLGQKTFLFADDLAVIQEERQKGGKEKAGALWMALKALFVDQ